MLNFFNNKKNKSGVQEALLGDTAGSVKSTQQLVSDQAMVAGSDIFRRATGTKTSRPSSSGQFSYSDSEPYTPPTPTLAPASLKKN